MHVTAGKVTLHVWPSGCEVATYSVRAAPPLDTGRCHATVGGGVTGRGVRPADGAPGSVMGVLGTTAADGAEAGEVRFCYLLPGL